MMAKRLSVIDAERCVGCQSCMFACVRRMGEGGLASCIGVHSAGGVRRGFVIDLTHRRSRVTERPDLFNAGLGGTGVGIKLLAMPRAISWRRSGL
jgi:ferredoxin